MKTLSLLAFTCLLACSGCKKADTAVRTILINTTNVNSTTTYTIVIKNTSDGTTPFVIDNATGPQNGSYSLEVKPGSVLNMDYGFYDQYQKLGQGNLDVTYNAQSLYHANGGNGKNVVINVP